MSSKSSKKTVVANVEVAEVKAKVPSKPTVAAKVATTKAAPAKPAAAKASASNAAKNAEIAEKKSQEHMRYQASLELAAVEGLVTVFNELTVSSVQDKWTTAVGRHVLEVIDQIQNNECQQDGDYNPFPPSGFILLEDKLTNGSKKKPVKNGKLAAPSSGSNSRSKKAPLKRGAKQVVDEPEEDDEAEDAEVDVALDDSGDADASADAPSDKKEEKKKNITTFTRDAKNYLGFVVMRFVDDYFSSAGGKNVKNRDDFVAFTNTMITQDINSHVSKSVVATVDRMRETVSNLSDNGVPDEFIKLVGVHFQDRSSVLRFMAEYFSEYLKLLGYVLAQQLWVSRKTINQPVVEAAVRLLDMGNDGLSNGLSCGFHRHARRYGELTVPKAPKKARPATGKKGKAAPAADHDDDQDADADQDEADAEADQDDEQEEDADEVEPEAEEEEEEPEPEPVPVKKQLKKLK